MSSSAPRSPFSVGGQPGAPPKLAATTILVRDAADGLQVLLMRRSGKSGFMGGAYVFPGGKVDPRDAEPTSWPGAPSPDAIARMCGAAVLAPEDAAAARTLLVAGAREALEEAGVQLALDALVPWGHWITPSAEPRRFDTWFFVGALAADVVVRADDHEAVELGWFAPSAALAAAAEGAMFLPPPTLLTLAELAGFTHAEAVLAAARARALPGIMPKLDLTGGRVVIVFPWDSGYAALEGEALPAFDPAALTPALRATSRVELVGDRWVASVG